MFLSTLTCWVVLNPQRSFFLIPKLLQYIFIGVNIRGRGTRDHRNGWTRLSELKYRFASALDERGGPVPSGSSGVLPPDPDRLSYPAAKRAVNCPL